MNYKKMHLWFHIKHCLKEELNQKKQSIKQMQIFCQIYFPQCIGAVDDITKIMHFALSSAVQSDALQLNSKIV